MQASPGDLRLALNWSALNSLHAKGYSNPLGCSGSMLDLLSPSGPNSDAGCQTGAKLSSVQPGNLGAKRSKSAIVIDEEKASFLTLVDLAGA
jgi:hypothetical protein